MTPGTDIPTSTYGVICQDRFEADVDEVAEDIRRVGYAVLDSGYTSAQVHALSSEFDRVRGDYVKAWGEERLRKLNEFHMVRALLTHGGPLFLQLAMHQTLHAVLKKLILGKYALNQQNGVVNPASESYNQGAWHRDLPYQHFVSSSPLAVNALFCLDDFTSENGGTFVLPASHKAVPFPSQKYVERHALQLEAKAGQFIVMDCMLFHSGGSNKSAAERRAINHAFMIPYFKQQIDIPLNMNPDGLSPEEKEMLGFSYQMPTSVQDYLSSREKKNV